MRRGDLSASLPNEGLLKIDKDCFVDARLNGQYVETILDTCKKHGVTVLSVKSTKTRHGMHFYIGMTHRLTLTEPTTCSICLAMTRSESHSTTHVSCQDWRNGTSCSRLRVGG